MQKLIRTHMKKIVTGGVAAAVIGGGAAAYALGQPAGPSLGSSTAADAAAAAQGQSPPASAANPNLRARAARAGLAIGEVTSVSGTGGAYNAGTITVQFPDGKSATVAVSPQTRIVAYHGPGDHPTKESLTDLKTGEVVVLRVARHPRASAQGNPAPGAAATPATPATPDRDRVLTMVIDTGFAAGASPSVSGGASSSGASSSL